MQKLFMEHNNDRFKIDINIIILSDCINLPRHETPLQPKSNGLRPSPAKAHAYTTQVPVK